MLGQGSFGITYLAEHTALKKRMCIKEFFMKDMNSRNNEGSITGMTEGSLSHNYAQKFKKEAQNLARMDHPNIVKVTDSFEQNGTFYYVMDFVEGVNLNDYLKNHYLSEDEATAIIRDVASALQYMHEEKNMLHLDLKPGNVMRRNSDGHVFLIDFGLSKQFSDSGEPETSTTVGLGTAGYAPVEQGNNAKNGEFRPTIDVYALGGTLYKLLTRETPPVASELVSEFEILGEKLLRAGVSPALTKVICNAMQPSVKKRTASVAQFVAQLNNTPLPPPPVTDETMVAILDNEDEQPIFTPTSLPPTPPNDNGGDKQTWKIVTMVLAMLIVGLLILIVSNLPSNDTTETSAEYEDYVFPTPTEFDTTGITGTIDDIEDSTVINTDTMYYD